MGQFMTFATLHHPPATPRRSPRARSRAYSLIEVLISLLIIQIIATFVMVSSSSLSDSSHLDQLDKRAIGCIRYARMLAMSSGQPCSVEFNQTAQTIKVFLGSSTTPVSNSMFPGGRCAINLASDQGVGGCTIGSVTNAATTGSQTVTAWVCTFGNLGTRTNAPSYSTPMTVTFNYGNASSILTIPNAGDPY
jgi:Tfp pilus assembly protein FimT